MLQPSLIKQQSFCVHICLYWLLILLIRLWVNIIIGPLGSKQNFQLSSSLMLWVFYPAAANALLWFSHPLTHICILFCCCNRFRIWLAMFFIFLRRYADTEATKQFFSYVNKKTRFPIPIVLFYFQPRSDFLISLYTTIYFPLHTMWSVKFRKRTLKLADYKDCTVLSLKRTAWYLSLCLIMALHPIPIFPHFFNKLALHYSYISHC